MRHIRRHWRGIFSIILGLISVLAVAGYAWQQERHFRNLYVVKPGVLYRSGQLTRKGLQRAIHELNIGTLVNLRGGDSDRRINTTSWEADVCEKAFITFVAIPLGSPEDPDSVTPEESERIIQRAAAQFLEIMNDPERYPRPILVHCLAGKHRTGVMSALFRMELDGWSKEQALAEMKQLGYDDFDGYDPLRDFIVHWTPQRDRSSAIQTIKTVEPVRAIPVSRGR